MCTNRSWTVCYISTMRICWGLCGSQNGKYIESNWIAWQSRHRESVTLAYKVVFNQSGLFTHRWFDKLQSLVWVMRTWIVIISAITRRYSIAGSNHLLSILSISQIGTYFHTAVYLGPHDQYNNGTYNHSMINRDTDVIV